MANGKTQVNVSMDDELEEKLAQMAKDDYMDRSKFIKKLINHEWLRRAGIKVTGTNTLAVEKGD